MTTERYLAPRRAGTNFKEPRRGESPLVSVPALVVPNRTEAKMAQVVRPPANLVPSDRRKN